MKLNLGCGDKPLAGWVNCDIAGRYDEWLDLNSPDWAAKLRGMADEILMDQVPRQSAD